MIERLSDIYVQTTETTERKPPTIADIVREKTDDGLGNGIIDHWANRASPLWDPQGEPRATPALCMACRSP